jgi:succinate dehydrogenase / fumarate reductase flavoprotein subunit
MSESPALVTCNVLVLGAGAAGLRAAIAAHDAAVDTMILGSRGRADAHTALAAGGINAALGTHDPDDWRQHFADTYVEGHALADPPAIELLCREAPRALEELAAWGCPFARTPDGRLDQRYFGAHRHRRTCYAGDYTGRAVLDTLLAQVTRRGVPIVEQTYVSSLLCDGGVCFGAYAFDVATGRRTAYLADAVVLATGGHTRLWRYSSSRRDENYGDGMALALAAGCELGDMEMVQFHPTGMTHPEEWAGALVTEAVRGEGGKLFNAAGERFMGRYDPDRMELSARDRVAAANYVEIAEGRGGPHGGVFLDVSHLDREQITEKLPRIQRQFLEAQMLDITAGHMEVTPTAHYAMGGVVVEPESHGTGVDGLYAAGEVTTGVHGANRLGGNSLTETVVFGRRAGEAAATRARTLGAAHRSGSALVEAGEHLEALVGPGDAFALPVLRHLRDLMWRGCGVVRSAASLREALGALDDVRLASARIDVQPSPGGWVDLARACAVRAALPCCEATLRGALAREESRGAHRRSDHPEEAPSPYNLVVAERGRGTLGIEARAPRRVPDELRPLLAEPPAEAAAGKLLE